MGKALIDRLVYSFGLKKNKMFNTNIKVQTCILFLDVRLLGCRGGGGAAHTRMCCCSHQDVLLQCWVGCL